MADKRPMSGVSEVSPASLGAGSVNVALGIGDGLRNSGLNASPAMNGTGNVSGVLLNNLCPHSQNSIP